MGPLRVSFPRLPAKMLPAQGISLCYIPQSTPLIIMLHYEVGLSILFRKPLLLFILFLFWQIVKRKFLLPAACLHSYVVGNKCFLTCRTKNWIMGPIPNAVTIVPIPMLLLAPNKNAAMTHNTSVKIRQKRY